VPAAAVPAIPIAAASLHEKVFVLFALFKSLLENTFSGDARELAVLGAIAMCRDTLGEERARAIARDLVSAARRQGSVFDQMFD
jgi:hypothetical protein